MVTTSVHELTKRTVSKSTRKGKPIVFWTEQEEDMLRQLYPNHSNKEIAQLLGKTKASIDKKGAQLGLRKSKEYRTKVSRDNNKNKDYVWSESELQTLFALYNHKTYKEIGKILNRSQSSIAHKAKQLNLHKYNKVKIKKVKVKRVVKVKMGENDNQEKE